VRTAGTLAIEDLVRRHGVRGVGRALDVDHKTVTKLLAGSSPRAPLRERLQKAYGVDPKAFEAAEHTPVPGPERARRRTRRLPSPGPEVEKGEAVAAAAPPPPPSPPPVDEGPVDPRAELGKLVTRLRQDLAKLDVDPQASPRERAQLAAAVTAAIRAITKLDPAPSLTMSTILRSEHWTRLRGAVLEALTPYPEALAAVLATVRKLDE
jgi:hypothetical protein